LPLSVRGYATEVRLTCRAGSLAAAGAFLVGLLGCAGLEVTEDAEYERLQPVSVSFVPAPRGKPQREFYDLDWSSPQKALVVSIGTATAGRTRAYLAMLRLDGSAPRRLGVPPEKECEIGEPFVPRTLRDGRIVHWSVCLGETTRADRNLRTLRVYDPDRSTAGRYVKRFFRLFNVGSFDFSPRSDAGVLSMGDLLSNKLYWLDRSGLEEVDVPLTNVGDVRSSPDGREVAVSGVPTEAGPDSPTRQDVPWSVFLVGSGEPREIMSGLQDGAALDWSPRRTLARSFDQSARRTIRTLALPHLDGATLTTP